LEDMETDVKPTIMVIRGIVKLLREAADDIDRDADNMVKTGELDYAAEVINRLSSLWPSFRLDLLVARPIRELEKRIEQIVLANFVG
jgi:hypothetical protein